MDLTNLPPTLRQFIEFIATPIVLGPILSQLLEYSKWFQERTAFVKTVLVYVLMVLVGVASYGIIHWAPATAALEWLQPVYAIMIAAAVFFGTSQLWHSKVHDGVRTAEKVVDVRATVIEEKNVGPRSYVGSSLDDYAYTEKQVAGKVSSSKGPLPDDAGEVG